MIQIYIQMHYDFFFIIITTFIMYVIYYVTYNYA